MKAVLIHGKQDFRYEDVPDPTPKDGEVVVKVRRCGICAADPKVYHGTAYFAQVAYDHAPIIAGHEFIGEVVALGKGAQKKYNLQVGDKAIAEQIVPCWQCYYCKRGMYNMCDVHEVFGISGPHGGWAQYMSYPKQSIIWKVPRDIPDNIGVGIEPLACAIHGVNRANIGLGDTVVITGLGTIGLFMLQVAKLKHPQLLIASDPDQARLDIAKSLGADITINPQQENALQKVKDLTAGLGCDIVLEASGYPRAVEDAVGMLRRRGTLMEFGVFARKVSLDFSIISDIKELTIIGGHLGAYTYPLAIKYLQEGLVRTDKIITHTFPLKDWREAIHTSERKVDGAIKVTMNPWEG